jgi:catechol 2,3-dioxygenase-like lactoylglutathione lyase family enzyme
MKLRTGDPWMPAPEYSRTLRGLTVNLIVRDIEAALAFQRRVLGAEVVYADPDFAVVKAHGGEWILHADHTYRGHAVEAALWGVTQRGAGIELRLHGCDPDRAEQTARELGYRVLAGATDKGHGTREAFIEDADGYVWVPDVPSRGNA